MMDLPVGNKQRRIWYHENKFVLKNLPTYEYAPAPLGNDAYTYDTSIQRDLN